MNTFHNQGQEFGRLKGREIERESINFFDMFMQCHATEGEF